MKKYFGLFTIALAVFALTACGNLFMGNPFDDTKTAKGTSLVLTIAQDGQDAVRDSSSRVYAPAPLTLTDFSSFTVQLYDGATLVRDLTGLAPAATVFIDGLVTGTTYTVKVTGLNGATTVALGETNVTTLPGANAANVIMERYRTALGTGTFQISLELSDLPSGATISRITLERFSPDTATFNLVYGSQYTVTGNMVSINAGLQSGSYYLRPVFSIAATPAPIEFVLNVDPLVEIFDGETSVTSNGLSVLVSTGDLLASGTKYYVSASGTGNGQLPSDPISFQNAMDSIASNGVVSALYPGTIVLVSGVDLTNPSGYTISKPTVIRSITSSPIHILTLSSNVSSGAVFNVETGGSLTATDVVLNGGYASSYNAMRGMIAVNTGGSATLGTNAQIIDSAGFYAGGVNVNGGSFLLDGGEIAECVSLYSMGGGVRVESGTFTFNAGTISNCQASFGGGVYVMAAGIMNALPAASIYDNIAAKSGGGLLLESKGSFNMGSVSLLETIVGANTASDGYLPRFGLYSSVVNETGLAAAAGETELPVFASIDSSFPVMTPITVLGKLFMRSSATVQAINADNTLSATMLRINPNAVCVFDTLILQGLVSPTVNWPLVEVNGGDLTMGQDAAMRSHTTNVNGGLVHVITNSSIARFTMNGGTLEGGSALNGGAIYVSSGQVNLNGGTIGNVGWPNTAGEKGGGVFSYGDVTIDGCTISYNLAAAGGGLFIGNPGTLTINETVPSTTRIINNSATSVLTSNEGNGGGIYLFGANASMSGGTIASNSAAFFSTMGSGGGVYLQNSGVPSGFVLSGGTVSSNTATNTAGPGAGGGGAFFVDNSSVLLTEGSTAVISSNVSLNEGGALFVRNGGTIELFGGTIGGTNIIAGNRSAKAGGAICSVGSTDILRIGDVNIGYNYTQTSGNGHGGAIYTQTAKPYFYLGSTPSGAINNNSADGSGGGLFYGDIGTEGVMLYPGTVSSPGTAYEMVDFTQFNGFFSANTAIGPGPQYNILCKVIVNENGHGTSINYDHPFGYSYITENRANFVPTAGTAEAFKFGGWDTNAGGGGTPYTPGQSITVTGHLTLYAQWVPFQLRDIGPGTGLIFYDKGDFTNGWRYLEAAPADLPSSAAQLNSTMINGTQQVLGTGKENTDLVYAYLNANGMTNCAAFLARNLTTGGFTDWFLPSSNELEAMRTSLYLMSVGTFASAPYWSSSESTTNFWAVDFMNASGIDSPRTTAFNVRAARRF